jgi:hypothetical protein
MKVSANHRVRLRRAQTQHRLRLRSALLLAAAIATLTALTAIPAAAGNSGGVAVSLSVVAGPVKSITVSPGSTSYTNCKYGTSTTTQLGFPNAICSGASTILITDGGSPATILVNGADFIPSDNGTHWALCGGSGGPACANGVLTGPNQAYETTSLTPGSGVDGSGNGPFLALSNNAVCDGIGFGCGQAAAGAQATEYLSLEGPSSSTDPSSSFSTSVTWTAS